MINGDEAKKLKQIRFKQRFSNFEKAYLRLNEFLKEDTEHDIVSRTALVHAFEFTFDLSWKSMKDLLEWKDGIEVSGPSAVLQEAYEQKYFKDTGPWAAALDMRNNASHVYNEDTAVPVEKFIRLQFKSLISDLYSFFKKYL
jgi:nucleotidyltransferase substrate binding protein (TIGR01987 family)